MSSEEIMLGEPVLDEVAQAVRDIADGRPVVVVDDADRENEGDIIVAASKMTPDLMAFMIRHTSGVICVPLPGEHLDRLQLPLMTPHNSERMRTAFTISVDARDGVTTGISAEDRARTVRTLVDSATEPYEIVRPGHIFPLRYAEGGVLRRPGHTEAAVDLARLAGLPAAGVLAEVVNDDGTMARLPQLREFADEHGLTLISIEQLIDYRRRSERMVSRMVETRLPNAYGQWRAFGYQNSVDQTEHLVLVLGDVGDGRDILVRAHSECLTGDVFGSRRCDCGDQLEASMAAIAAEGRGVVLYLRGHEGRGIGLISKLRAYQLQDAGADTVDANLELGLPADAREYSTGAQILADLGVRSVRLLTNNPAKVSGLSGFGVEVAGRVALPVTPTPENLRYLTVKRDRLGHLIDGLPATLNGAPAHGERLSGTAQRLRHSPGRRPVSAVRYRLASPGREARRCRRGCRWRGLQDRCGRLASPRADTVSGEGRPAAETVDAAGLTLAIAVTRWHAEITDALTGRALAAAKACGVNDPLVVRVPGAVELPVVAAELARRHDAVACLGAVIRGGTPHFEYVCDAVTYGIARVALDTGKPVGNGVLTCDTLEQARDRSGQDGSCEDKGWEAVVAALETALVLRSLRGESPGDGNPQRH